MGEKVKLQTKYSFQMYIIPLSSTLTNLLLHFFSNDPYSPFSQGVGWNDLVLGSK
jgi:hypothetical protein